MKLSARYSLLVAVILLALTSIVSAQSAAPDKKTAEIIARQREYFAAVKKKDGDALAAMLTDGYIGVYADGMFDRATELKALADFQLNDYEVSQEKVAFANSRMATITFKLRVKVYSNAGSFYETDNVVCVWILEKKKWRMTSQAAVKVHGA